MTLNDELRDYTIWASHFKLEDDGLAAFRALRAMDQISHEFDKKGEGYLERIKDIAFTH